jgi:subtilase-type serine protease
LSSSSPIQIYPEAFLYGSGTIHGNLVVQGTMTVGEVTTHNNLSHLTEYFSFDKLHTDGTPPTQLLFLAGDFSTGYVSEGINVEGDITFSPESTLVIKFSPSMLNRIDTNGKIILDSPKILLTPAEGVYRIGQNYQILYAGSIQGEVGSISSRYAMINPLISYITEDTYSGVSFSLALNSFSSLFGASNTAPVAAFLDSLAANPSENSPIIIEALINTATIEDLSKALAQLQPSAFTSLSVMQQNDLFYIRNAIYSRLYQEQQNCLCLSEDQNEVQIWGGIFGGSTHQTNQDEQPGYLARSPGAILALDALISENAIFGAGVGYIYTFQDWKRHRGNANIQNVYGSIYSQYANANGFFIANLVGGYSFFDVNRKINIGPGSILHATANSHFGGFDGSIDLRMGAHIPVKAALITPFLGFDYMVVQQNSTHEKGARVLNLKIKNHVGDLLTSEAGFECNFCHQKERSFLKALLRFSVIGESRFFGRYEKATFSNGDSFKVKGYYPCRILGSAGAGLSASFDRSTFFLTYQAKTNWQFTDQFLTLEYLWRF